MRQILEEPIEQIQEEIREERKRIEKENKVQQKRAKKLTSTKTSSTQSLLGELLGIEPDGQLILSGNKRCQILELDFTTFDRHVDSQKSILLALLHQKVILNLTHSVQILRISKPTNVSDVIEGMRDQAAKNPEELYRNIGEQIAGFVREVAVRSFIQDVRYFLVVPCTLGESQELPESGLLDKLPMVKNLSGITGSLGSALRPIKNFYTRTNPEDKNTKISDIQQLREMLSQRVEALAQSFTSAQLKVTKLGPLSSLEVIASVINGDRFDEDMITADDLISLMQPIARSIPVFEGAGPNSYEIDIEDLDLETIDSRAVELFSGSSADIIGGLRTAADLLAPDIMSIGENYICVDGQYQSTLAMYTLPHKVDPNVLNVLDPVNMPNVVSFFVHPISADYITSLLDYQAGGYLSSIHQTAKYGGIPDHTQTLALEHNQKLREEVERGEEMCARISMYFKVTARSIEELDINVKRYINTLKTVGFKKIKPAHLRHDLGFKTVLPLCRDYLNISRMADGRTVTRILIGNRERLCHRDGFFVGKATTGVGNIMMLNLRSRDLRNGHLFVCGASGAGKSVVTKYFVTQARVLTKSRIFILDPDCEYGPLVELLNGKQVIISPQSEDACNLLDFNSLKKSRRKSLQKGKNSDAEDKDPLAWHISMLKDGEALPRLVGNGPLNGTQLSILDSALFETYKRKEITREIQTHSIPAPLLQDLQEVLYDFADPDYKFEGTRMRRKGWSELAEEMADNLEQYTHGAYASLFNRPTNIDFSNRFLAFGIQDISDKSPIAPIAYWMLAMCIWNSAKMMDESSIIMVDEASHIMKVAGGANLILDIAQRGRKKNVSLWLCTQHPYSLLMHPQGETIMANISSNIMLGQEDAGATALREKTDLNEYEISYLLSCGSDNKGQGILQVKRDRSFIEVIVPPALLNVLNTDPRELEEEDSEEV